MESATVGILFTYLLFPIIGIIMAALMIFVAKKNNLLNNKKAIFYFLLSCVILALPALFGFVHYWFMPYIYISLQITYLILGYYNLNILSKLVDQIDEKPYYLEFLFVFSIAIVGAALFSLVFNLCNELQYGLWASTCILTFIFPSRFRKAYQTYMEIPLEIYKIWSYSGETNEIDMQSFDQNKIIVVELELFKQVSDSKPLNIKAKASESMPFGVWFKVFIDDYNKKSPQYPITYADYDNSYGWIFYTRNSLLGNRKYIDPELTFAKNKIKEENVIIAKRTVFANNTIGSNED